MSVDDKPGLTPSQTVGPYFSIGLDWAEGNCLRDAATVGEAITIQGQVLDGDGAPVPDAMVEIWQADAHGEYAGGPDAVFRGAGRAATDANGRYDFATVKPGAVIDGERRQAPHINVAVFARGLLVHLYTRIYFPDEAAANAADAVLGCVPPARRGTLIAQRDGDHLSFDIRLQGDRETVFFDV